MYPHSLSTSTTRGEKVAWYAAVWDMNAGAAINDELATVGVSPILYTTKEGVARPEIEDSKLHNVHKYRHSNMVVAC